MNNAGGKVKMSCSFYDSARTRSKIVFLESNHGSRGHSPHRGRYVQLAGLLFFICALLAGLSAVAAGPTDGLTIAWTNNMLAISGSNIPGGKVEILYLEAFCRSGSTHRDWKQTTIPHKTELIEADKEGKRLRLRTLVEPSVEVLHDIEAGRDEVDFRMELKNKGDEAVDVQWVQPCMRVDGFTGLKQDDYIQRSFIFTKDCVAGLD